ncbi:hypothetical protein DPMN_185099 [Dreissena polymorpha]|uniref:Uncharacterized protein n=1 Tax=Dreissena polymorpha TaxID=45954 RepID=A0A9D4DJ24_DREPO|nr:hypothetical protein DPMN_185099 [Dreissena polymorpha]
MYRSDYLPHSTCPADSWSSGSSPRDRSSPTCKCRPLGSWVWECWSPQCSSSPQNRGPWAVRAHLSRSTSPL